MAYREKYNYWLENEYFDEKIKEELRSITDEREIEDRFYKDLTFGTAGLRGKVGAGTNRMNRYTVSLATQGLAQTIVNRGPEAMDKGVAIAYDVRHFSKEFAEIAARVLAGNGVKSYLFDGIRTTPLLSYTIRKLSTISGIVVTASHNPMEYNGYKVYWEEGSQILDDIGGEILDNINLIEDFSQIKVMDMEEALNKGLITYIGKEIDDAYNDELLKLAINEDIDKEIKIVYTPLNGTGNIPVRRILSDRGFTNVMVVPEQENPDPNFTTVGYPNPEDIKAFDKAKEFGKEVGGDILIATDPDCDRIAAMVRDEGEFKFINGNQMGSLLVNYILFSRHRKGDLPKDGAIVKSIVTGNMGKVIAKSYGIKTFESLTGFKFICEYPNIWEKTKEQTFIFGYEESIGYTYGSHVRDKDGVVTAMLIAEMAAYYKKEGKTLIDVLNELYEEYGYFNEELISIVLEGVEGSRRISRIMDSFRAKPIEFINGVGIESITDYLLDETGNAKSNVLKYNLLDDSWYVIRPSGTEPKLKLYIYSKGKNKEDSEKQILNLKSSILDRMNSIE